MRMEVARATAWEEYVNSGQWHKDTLARENESLGGLQWTAGFDAGYDAATADLTARLAAAESAVRYCLATLRALERYTFYESEHGLLIKEAARKLEALEDEREAHNSQSPTDGAGVSSE